MTSRCDHEGRINQQLQHTVLTCRGDAGAAVLQMSMLQRTRSRQEGAWCVAKQLALLA
jgi:hypothetical protein